MDYRGYTIVRNDIQLYRKHYNWCVCDTDGRIEWYGDTMSECKTEINDHKAGENFCECETQTPNAPIKLGDLDWCNDCGLDIERI